MAGDGGTLGWLARTLNGGGRVLAAWTVLGDAGVAEALVRAGFDAAVLDLQHGTYSFEEALRGIAAVAMAGAPALCRVPVGDYATAARLFDAGAAAVIAPMIESARDARALVSMVKFPPLGERSWGPGRALALTGLDPKGYFARANEIQLALPMIETRAALAALDEILAVPGVDGVLVGPSDLSVALTGGAPDPNHPEVQRALDHVASRTRAAGKVAAFFCTNGAQACSMLARGFALCSISTDAGLLAQAARAELAAAKG